MGNGKQPTSVFSFPVRRSPVFLEFNPVLGENATAKGMFYAFHLGHKIRGFDEGCGSPSPRKDDMLRRGPFLEGLNDFGGLQKFILECDMDLVKNNERILGVPEQRLALLPRL